MLNDFLISLGFLSDPFEYTDADKEDRLRDYFVPPPYFESVLGNPEQPASVIVFAPRGSGKSAQRRTIEDHSDRSVQTDLPFLAITHDNFAIAAGASAVDVTWQDHIDQVIRGLLLEMLIRIDQEPYRVDNWSRFDREFFTDSTVRYLDGITAEQYDIAQKSIRTFRRKLNILLDRYGGPINILTRLALSKLGAENREADATVKPTAPLVGEERRSTLSHLLRLTRLMGFASVYILVDRVDETHATSGDAKNAYELIRPLLADLQTLNQEGVAFKFFLWDRLKERYQESGHRRPDRVREYTLRWLIGDLSDMLSRRLAAYSDNQVASFNQLVDDQCEIDIHALLCWLCFESPRDLIRLCGRVVSEHIRTSSTSDRIPLSTIYSSVWDFSNERSGELCNIAEVRRVKDFEFLANDLANDIFRISTDAMLNKIRGWCNSGVVQQISLAPGLSRTGRPRNVYAIVDPRVALASRKREDVEDMLMGALYSCPSCGRLVVCDRLRLICPHCHSEHESRQAATLLEIVSS